MERQYVIFIVGAAVSLGTLVIVGLFFNPLQTQGENAGSNNIIKAKIGQEVSVRYSSGVVSQIQNLPAKNIVTVEVSSELHNSDLAGSLGGVRYNEMVISYVQNGKEEEVADEVFPTIEYRFFPDAGNKSKYSYEDVSFVATSDSAQFIVRVIPLESAKVGEKYAVKLILDTLGIVQYTVSEKIVEIVS